MIDLVDAVQILSAPKQRDLHPDQRARLRWNAASGELDLTTRACLSHSGFGLSRQPSPLPPSDPNPVFRATL